MRTQPETRPSTRGHDTASALVTFLGLYHGAVPLVVRLLFDRDQRFAPALWLPAPWWWIACLAVVVVALGLLALIDDAKQRRRPSAVEEDDVATQPDEPRDEDGRGAYDAASGLVFLVGIYNGVAPFVARLVFDRDALLLALPLRLAAPWWWIVSLVVVVATIAALAAIDAAKQRRFPV